MAGEPNTYSDSDVDEILADKDKRIAELEERVAFVELQACHAINAIDKGDIADARLLLEEATRDMFKP